MMIQSPNEDTSLVKFLRDHPTRKKHLSFPKEETDYYRRFQEIDRYLNETVHPVVNQGATAHGDGWLTDHGTDHITTVIRRAGELAVDTDGEGESITLTPYEVFLLVSAIHFHDVGNVFGRDQHEKEITNIMCKLNDNLLGDGVERRMIRDIAMAHGGYVGDEQQDKDTIGHLTWEHSTTSNEPRVRFLAAVLRFADELADDYTRTRRFLLEGKLTKDSEIYHMYADRLRRVSVEPKNRKVVLLFELDVEHATTEYQKGHDRVYLYDEIVTRSIKMHRENIYCGRFTQTRTWPNMIDVAISIAKDRYMTELMKINFTLAQQGYPSNPKHLTEAISSFSFDSLQENDTRTENDTRAEELDGKELERRITQRLRNSPW